MRWTLTDGTICQIDPEDLAVARASNWRSTRIANLRYVTRTARNKDGRQTTEYLHRVILDVPQGIYVDHIDHDGLNNTRSNLRPCSMSENMRNQRRQRRKKLSRFKGVTRQGKWWRAQLQLHGKHISLGMYADEDDAAEAYRKGALKHFGEFACTT